MADEDARPVALRRLDDGVALVERQAHRLVEDDLLAALRGHDGVRGVHLVRRHHVDNVDAGISAQPFRVVVGVPAEVALEPLACGGSRVGDGNDVRVRVGAQLGDHVHRACTQTDDAEVQWCVGCHGYAVAWCC